MSIDAELIRNASEEGKKELAERHPLLAGRELDNLFSTRFDRWERETEKKLEQNFPLKQEFRELENSESDLDKSETDRESLEKDIANFSTIDTEAAEDLSKELEKAEDEDLGPIHGRLVAEWGHELEQRKLEWMMSAIEKRRRELVDSLEKWLKLIETATQATDALGIGTSPLWDLMDQDVTSSETETLEKWSTTFRNDPNVRRICETLGRMCSFEVDGLSE